MPDTLAAARERLAAAKATLDDRRARGIAAVDAYKAAYARAVDYGDAHGLLLALADSTRDRVKSRVEDVVTLALQGVFGGSHRFRFDVSMARGVVNMTPMVGTGPDTWMKLDECAGGVVDIVAFALRVTLLAWRRPRLRPVLVADEPFRHVSDDYLPAVAEMLANLTRVTGIQMVIVSHEQQLAEAADNIVTVRRSGPHSVAASTYPGTNP